MTPGVPETPALTIEALLTDLRELQGMSQAPPGDRYRLKPPIFGGEGNVERLICEFEEWPVPVCVLQLRACLTGRANSFAFGPDEAHILRALQTGLV